MRPMQESKPLIYLLCTNCQHGEHYSWTMTHNEYYLGFIIRKCPKCGFLDTKNSLGGSTSNKPGIIMKAVDW